MFENKKINLKEYFGTDVTLDLSKIFLPSVIILIIVNLVPLFGVYLFSWSTAEVLLLYWSESAVVGFYTVLKIILLKNTEIPYKSVSERTKKLVLGGFQAFFAKLSFILFFIFHFGGFMGGHLLFLVIAVIPLADMGSSFSFQEFSLESWLFALSLLFLSHGFSFLTNYIMKKEYRKTTMQALMFAPYQRIVIMHLAIILGALTFLTVFVLISLKILFDLVGHLSERKMINIAK